MPYDVEWKQGAIEDVTTLFDYIAENSSLWDAQNVTDRVLAAADKLADFPRLYEVDSRYGEDVRRISLMGQHVLYEVDDPAQKVRVLAVVGQRQVVDDVLTALIAGGHVLVEGVPDVKDEEGRRIYFLRRLPRDPMHTDASVEPERTWGRRSYASEATEPREGDDVYDVYCTSSKTGLNNVPYRLW